MSKGLLLSFLLIALIVGTAIAEQPWFELPKQPVPPFFGNFLIDRVSTKNDMKAVEFSHWRHRLEYTCRVCHFELDFQMKTNATEITEEMNRNGLFCGACHDGKTAFGHTEKNCKRCHTGTVKSGVRLFKKVLRRMPPSDYGNLIDWNRAVLMGRIRPKQSIFEDDYAPIPFDKEIKLEAVWSNSPEAIFPHKAHTMWLDCANCHPGVFNIKKKGTKSLTMSNILDGEFCGACHLNVAFPLDDCVRCHPTITTNK
jgi:c(7)-type cytochrome triheme protein